jgi:predicted secreted hydrolase
LGIFLGSGTWWFSLSGFTAYFRQKISSGWMSWINRISGSIIALFGIFAILGLVAGPTGLDDPPPNETSKASAPTSPLANFDRFQRVTGPLPLSFPQDHGAHSEYLTEWWYYTGNLRTAEGRHFGYQFTIFRRAIHPPGTYALRPSAWATDQIYLAHFTVTDVQSETFQAFERTSRGAAGLAGAISEPLNVWLYDWHVEQIGMDAYRIHAVEGDYSIALDLNDEKGPVLHGNAGYSRKGVDPGNASTYISLTRLRTAGTVKTPEGSFEVSGYSWMDHEFSTNALSIGQIGWDWFSVQLEDSTELMVYQIRREDGTVDPYSSGTYISQVGASTALNRNDFTIEVLDTWESPHSGAVYPSRWRVHIELLELDLEILPVLADQELNLSFTYWEGAVTVRGIAAGRPVTGIGYVELTGYREPFSGDF